MQKWNVQRAMRGLGRMQDRLVIRPVGGGYHSAAPAIRRRGTQRCEDCLWNWPDLHGGTGRTCYHNTSPRYHQEAGGKACFAFETRVEEDCLG